MAEYVGTKNDAGDLATQADLDKLITAQATAPSSPSVGDLWFDTDNGKLFIYYDSFWVNPASIGAGIETAAPGAIQPDNTAFEGTSANLARADHRHAIAAASAGTITGTNAEGTSTSFARADHNHALGADVVTATELRDDAATDANRAVTTNHIRDGAVTSAKIADGTIANVDVSASAAIAESKLSLASDAAAGTASRRTLGTGATQACAGNDSRLSDSRTPTGTAGGSLSGTYPNPTLATDSVGASQIAANAVGSSEIAADAVGASEIAASAVGTSEIASDAVTSDKLSLTSTSDTPSANTTFNAASGSTDVTGLSITCAAGTWLIIAHLDVTHFSGTPRIDVWNFTDSSTIGNANFITGLSNPSRLPISLMRFTTFTDTKSVTIRMSTGYGTSNFTIEYLHTTLTAIRLG